MTLVTSLCEILHVSEHELLTASDDMHQREIEEQSRGYLRILKGYTWVTYLCYLGSLIPVLYRESCDGAPPLLVLYRSRWACYGIFFYQCDR